MVQGTRQTPVVVSAIRRYRTAGNGNGIVDVERPTPTVEAWGNIARRRFHVPRIAQRALTVDSVRGYPGRAIGGKRRRAICAWSYLSQSTDSGEKRNDRTVDSTRGLPARGRSVGSRPPPYRIPVVWVRWAGPARPTWLTGEAAGRPRVRRPRRSWPRGLKPGPRGSP